MQVTTVHQVQALVRGRRKDLGLSQESLARSAGASRKWLSEFERGATTAVELPLVLSVLAALDLAVDIRTKQPSVAELSAGAASLDTDCKVLDRRPEFLSRGGEVVHVRHSGNDPDRYVARAPVRGRFGPRVGYDVALAARDQDRDVDRRGLDRDRPRGHHGD